MNATSPISAEPPPAARPEWPATTSQPHRWIRFGVGLGCALASGLLLWASFFPLNVGWLAWFALVPLLALVRLPLSAGTRSLLAFVSGLTFFFPALHWLRVADDSMALAWFALAPYCAAYFLVAIALLCSLDRLRVPLVIAAPCVWVGLEYIRSFALSGFAWYFVGHSQHDYLPVIQVADLAGVYAISLALVAVNAALLETLTLVPALHPWLAGPASPSFKTWVPTVAGVGLLMAGLLAYGLIRLGHEPFRKGPIIALVQGNVDQRIRNARNSPNEDRQAATQMMLADYVPLSKQARDGSPRPDLIVWPETSYPFNWYQWHPSAPPGPKRDFWARESLFGQRLMADMCRAVRTPMLLGLNTEILDAQGLNRKFNSGLLVFPDGRVAEERFDKIHCVPFGEYLPFRQSLPWLQRFTPYDHEYSLTPGDSFPRYRLTVAGKTYRFGVLICIEGTDAPLALNWVADDAVDFLLNISNDGWFDGTSEHEQHLAITRFRAVECRRAVLRAVNMGISAVIDSDGRVTHVPAEDWQASKKMAGLVVAPVPLDERGSVYARLGDWLPQGCLAAILATLLAGTALRRFRHP